MRCGICYVDAERLVPAIPNLRQGRVKGIAQRGDDLRQGICEIFVFAAPKTVPCHDYPTAKQSIRVVALRQNRAFLWRQQRFGGCTAKLVQIGDDRGPIQRRDALADRRRSGLRSRLLHLNQSHRRADSEPTLLKNASETVFIVKTIDLTPETCIAPSGHRPKLTPRRSPNVFRSDRPDAW